MLGLDLSCAVYHQNQWVFCPAMFMAGFLGCTVIYAFAYIALYRWLISKGLQPYDVEDVAIRVVSVVHAMWLAIPFAHAALTEPLPTTFTSHFQCATFLISASLGYFFFDTIALLHWSHAKGRTWRSEISMLWHHVVAFGGEYFTLVWHAGGFLVAVLVQSEYTTPLLHLLYVLEKTGYLGDNRMTKFLCGLFAVQWIVFRIGVSIGLVLYGVFHSQAFWELSLQNKALYVIVAGFFNIINVFWFLKLLRKAGRLNSKVPLGSKKDKTR